MGPTGRLTGRAARWMLASLLGPAAAAAQDRPAEAPEAGADPQIEITAKPLTDTEQRRRDPVARTIYGREELERYGDISVGDALKRLPGVTMQGGSPRLRGLGAGYTQLLVNGEPAPPGFSLDNLSPGQVERIELTRGPSAEYSAQAVAGTVNIVLREAPRSRQRELTVRLGYQAVRPTVSANGSWGDRVGEGAGTLSWTVPAAVYQWRGRADTTSLRQALGPDGNPQRLDVAGTDQYWGHGFNLGPRLSWKLDEQDSLDWQTFAQRHDHDNQARFVTEVLEGQPPVSVDDRLRSGGGWQMLRSGLQWQRKQPDGSRWELRGGFQASSSRALGRTEGVDADGTPTLMRETRNHNSERSLTAGGKHGRPLGEVHTLVLGWDGERRRRTEQRSIVENGADLLPGFEGLPFEADLGRVALFAQDEWELAPRWSASLGLRGERIVTTSAGQDGPLRNTSQVITPLLHLNHRLDGAGKDLVRASLTRSYKAPELNQLMARPSINPQYPASGPNTEIHPDSIGNPALNPELATGLDLAFEQYLAQGGVLGIGGFYRRISGVIRNQVTLQAVPWAQVPRWVSQPVNLSQATSVGLELELKGRGDELLTALADRQPWLKGLNLRSSANVYRSSVDGIPGPDNRLAGQPPWSATAGFDQALGPAFGGPPLTVGASLAYTPGYRTQQTADRALVIDPVRSLDAYAMWAIARQTTLRLAASNLLADGSRSLTEVLPADDAPQFIDNTRSASRSFGLGLTARF
ncbi:MAG: TonB-dependent receptor [Burkholderiaceae bacterium]|nr:TonB-dependent receptor [Burkholderiaceae bacterium]